MLKCSIAIAMSVIVGACQASPPSEAVEPEAEETEALTADWTGCSCDSDCNDGRYGSERVCSNSGAEAGTCIRGCHSDFDCPTGMLCYKLGTPHWFCAYYG
jgi:hypothetical protein